MKPCAGKVGFASFALAEAAGQRARSKHKKVHVYHCLTCRLFHTGTQDGRFKRHMRTIGEEE